MKKEIEIEQPTTNEYFLFVIQNYLPEIMAETETIIHSIFENKNFKLAIILFDESRNAIVSSVPNEIMILELEKVLKFEKSKTKKPNRNKMN